MHCFERRKKRAINRPSVVYSTGRNVGSWRKEFGSPDMPIECYNGCTPRTNFAGSKFKKSFKQNLAKFFLLQSLELFVLVKFVSKLGTSTRFLDSPLNLLERNATRSWQHHLLLPQTSGFCTRRWLVEMLLRQTDQRKSCHVYCGPDRSVCRKGQVANFSASLA